MSPVLLTYLFWLSQCVLHLYTETDTHFPCPWSKIECTSGSSSQGIKQCVPSFCSLHQFTAWGQHKQGVVWRLLTCFVLRTFIIYLLPPWDAPHCWQVLYIYFLLYFDANAMCLLIFAVSFQDDGLLAKHNEEPSSRSVQVLDHVLLHKMKEMPLLWLSSG